jgi:hypothetical protein
MVNCSESSILGMVVRGKDGDRRDDRVEREMQKDFARMRGGFQMLDSLRRRVSGLRMLVSHHPPSSRRAMFTRLPQKAL